METDGKGQEILRNGKPIRSYDCAECPAAVRARRKCDLWPPPEFDELADHVEAVSSTWSREEAMQHLANMTPPTPRASGLMAELVDAERQREVMRQVEGLPRCPRLDISPTSIHYLGRYWRHAAFRDGFGGIAAPANIDQMDVREHQAWNIIRQAYSSDAVREGEE